MIGSQLSYFACGILAGLLGGYLGLGGGVVIVPYLTFISGIDIKSAVPASVTAIVVNSLSSSTEYIRKDMVDFELAIALGLAMTLGNIGGSLVEPLVSQEVVRVLFASVLLYTAYTFLAKKDSNGAPTELSDHKYYWGVVIAAVGTGFLGALIGVGGGLIIVPLLYVVLGVPLSRARGTSSFVIGLSTCAAVAVYLIADQIDLTIIPGLLVGTIIGGKVGGYLGTLAKPKPVKILFVLLLLYLAARFIYQAVQG